MNLSSEMKKKQKRKAESVVEKEKEKKMKDSKESPLELIDAKIQFELAKQHYKLYQSDKGEKKGYFLRETIKCLQEAVSLGLPEAMCMLGQMYKNREGIEEDRAEAAAETLFKLAIEGGSVQAKYDLAVLYDDYDDIQKTHEMIRLFTEAADAGMLEARYQLGLTYENDEPVQSLKKAIECYELIAEKHSNACFQLGKIYREGNEKKGVAQDLKKAIYYFELALLAGESPDVTDQPGRPLGAAALAAFALAEILVVGEGGIAQNLKRAVSLYELAALQGSCHASHALARLYKTGRGVPRNPEKAIAYYQSALAVAHSSHFVSEATRLRIEVELAELRLGKAQYSLGAEIEPRGQREEAQVYYKNAAAYGYKPIGGSSAQLMGVSQSSFLPPPSASSSFSSSSSQDSVPLLKDSTSLTSFFQKSL
ncbi:MAG: hypothetical protein QM752_00580 [Gammaproteobacteria bacterium]